MTPEEMGAALGAGWTWGTDPWPSWRSETPWVEVVSVPGFDPAIPRADTPWRVYVFGGDGDSTCEVGCVTPEAAVAVADLLVAAERVAGGAAVTVPLVRPLAKADGGIVMARPSITAGISGGFTPAAARCLALDLLRAADEAEAQT